MRTTVQITDRIPRCRLVTYDPLCPDIETPLFGVMKTLDKFHQGRAGVYAEIIRAGAVNVNDVTRVIE